jgi:hypothetical protein
MSACSDTGCGADAVDVVAAGVPGLAVLAVLVGLVGLVADGVASLGATVPLLAVAHPGGGLEGGAAEQLARTRTAATSPPPSARTTFITRVKPRAYAEGHPCAPRGRTAW